jgi:hypothetical protein
MNRRASSRPSGLVAWVGHGLIPKCRERCDHDTISRGEFIRSYGSFTRTFTLPPTVDVGNVSAEYKTGVLTVRLPLREEAKPKQIKVEMAA